jgi:hypothetical protein
MVAQIPIDEVPRRIAEVHSHVRQSVEDQKQIAVEEVRRELSAQLPEMESLKNVTVTEAVTSVFTERLNEKSEEMEGKLRAAQGRERKLRRKLERALSQVQAIATPVKGESPLRTMAELDGIDLLREDWEIQRKQLDMKMSELTRGLSSGLRSTPTHASIFHRL